jgi:hypothetical protein
MIPDVQHYASQNREPYSSQIHGIIPLVESDDEVEESSSRHYPQQTGQSWYARLSEEKKAEYLQRHHIARQQNKAAARRDFSQPK